MSPETANNLLIVESELINLDAALAALMHRLASLPVPGATAARRDVSQSRTRLLTAMGRLESHMAEAGMMLDIDADCLAPPF